MRNTAPCILYASLKIQKENEDAVMIVAPSDHWIEDEKAFKEDVQLCFEAAQGDDDVEYYRDTGTIFVFFFLC